ncbi:MAG: hypothetical protein J6S04_06830, partial [Clostridia bacterium]|nr:hypothetical protein [Clostridia bacterium]
DGNGETALLAGRVWNATKIENVNAQFASIEWVYGTFNEYGNTGLLVARWSESAKTGWMKDVTIDATGLDITCALGCELGTIYNTIFENVTVKGDSYEIIGSTASNCQSASLISEWPTGVTYICTKVVDGLEVTAPAESAYYTFNGQSSVAAGGSYTFTVAEKVSGLNDFIVLVNGQEMTGVNGTYTVENVTEALTIQVLHGYIEYGSGASVSYDGDAATVTNSTSTSNEAYMAYISAEYVNYLLSQGYNYWDFYIIPDGEIANQTVISCGNTISRSTQNAETAIARLQLKADTAIKFWCQKDGSGSGIQGAGGSMTVVYGSLRETA